MAARVALLKKAEAGGNYFSAPKKGIKFIPSGSHTLDLALGGGWAENRIANVIGDKSTGKTLLCIEAAANFIRKYPKAKVRYREAEEAFDNDYAEALGMPIKAIDFGPDAGIDTVEDFHTDLEKVINAAKGPEFYIIDSLDALTDEAELDRKIGDASYGGDKAKKLSQMFRRLVRPLAAAHVTVLVVSQVRAKIGQSFGAGRTTLRSGGKALDFYASQVLYLTQIGTLSREVGKVRRTVGLRVIGKLDKNKVGMPMRQAEFPIMFGYGIDDLQSCFNWLNEVGSLKAVGIAAKDIKKVSRELVDDPDPEFAAKVHKVVSERWYEIEHTFLPKRSKYGR